MGLLVCYSGWVVELGTVTAPSGSILIVDAGLLGMWSHDRAPVFPDGLHPPEVSAKANEAVDATIVGADAERVGRQLDRQWNPHFAYDLPPASAKDLASQVKDIAKVQGLDARLETLRERVPHRRRADNALAYGKGAGEVQFHGVWAGVVSGVPPRELRVVGEPMPQNDPDSGRLRRISVIVSDRDIARSEQFAFAAVDWARLLVVDLDAVGMWKHDEPIDGLADFAFWGLDAEVVSKRTGATEIESGVFGWCNLPVEEAADRGAQVEQLRDQQQLKFATDFRPHSHHHQLMQQIRASPTESGVVTLGGARACGFMTTWGDGIFELHRDLDADGGLVQIRIELGTDQRRKLMRQVELRGFTSALVSKKIVDEREPVRFMYREAADREQDSGWRMFSGSESPEYNDRSENVAIVPLSKFAEMDKRVDKLLDEPIGSVFERRDATTEFEPVTDWSPPGS